MVLLQSLVFPLLCWHLVRAGLVALSRRRLKNLPRKQHIGILSDDSPVGLVPAGPLTCDVQVGYAGSQMTGRYVPQGVSGVDGDSLVPVACIPFSGTVGRSREHSRVCDRCGRLPAGVEG